MVDNGKDIWLKLTTLEQAIDTLSILGMNEFVRTDDKDLSTIGDIFNLDVAIKYWPNLLTKRATYDDNGKELTPPGFGGPHLMIRVVSQRVRGKMQEKFYEAARDDNDGLVRKPTPAGVEIVDSPGTVVWA